MDFRGRSSQATPAPAPAPVSNPVSPASPTAANRNKKVPTDGRSFKVISIVLLFAVVALMIALITFFMIGGRSAAADIQKDHYQAVFLNNGQVYFGHINRLSGKSIDLRNIYYLQTNGSTTGTSSTQTQNNNVSLVKLGCELHSPYDQMIINTDQVIFWENIKDDGQVVKAIDQYGDKDCSQQSQNSTQQSAPASNSSSSSNTSGSAASGNTTSGTGSSNKKTP